MENRSINFSPVYIGDDEINNVVEVLKSGWITTGPKTKEFEQKISSYLGTSKTAALNSCTAALEMTLRLLNIKEGDEVIIPAYTYSATAAAVAHSGAKIIMIDSNKNNFHMDYSKLESYISSKTKAIIPVDIAGIPCDYSKIFEILEKNKGKFKANGKIQEAIGRIAVITDAAHSFGATYDDKFIGSIADFTCFSFHAVKNLTTGEGGAVTWKSISGIDDDYIYSTYMQLSLHGQTKDALSKNKSGQWEYDIIAPLYKCNMTDISAAIGLGQLDKYEKFLNKREELINKYDELLKDDVFINPQHFTNEYKSSGHLYLLRINGIKSEQRDQIIDEMSKFNIACNVHYKPLPLLTAYKNLGFDIKDYQNAYELFENEISLPLHYQLSEDDIEYICSSLKKILKKVCNYV